MTEGLEGRRPEGYPPALCCRHLSRSCWPIKAEALLLALLQSSAIRSFDRGPGPGSGPCPGLDLPVR